MPIEGLNIFSVGGFTFFLLILSIGYFVIEIVFYKFDFVRAVFKRYNNNLFDRVIMYILVGIVTNILYFFFLTLTNGFQPLTDFFNESSKIGQLFSYLGKEAIYGFQIISTSLIYFLGLIVILISLGFLVHFIKGFICMLIYVVKHNNKEIIKNIKKIVHYLLEKMCQ